jgi:hypothetical protein
MKLSRISLLEAHESLHGSQVVIPTTSILGKPLGCHHESKFLNSKKFKDSDWLLTRESEELNPTFHKMLGFVAKDQFISAICTVNP